MKSTSGWYDNGSGTDDYGFSALPGGYGGSGGYFTNAVPGGYGYWWSATESEYGNGSDVAYYRYMCHNYNYVYRDFDLKSYLFSVRCVRD